MTRTYAIGHAHKKKTQLRKMIKNTKIKVIQQGKKTALFLWKGRKFQ